MSTEDNLGEKRQDWKRRANGVEIKERHRARDEGLQKMREKGTWKRVPQLVGLIGLEHAHLWSNILSGQASRLSDARRSSSCNPHYYSYTGGHAAFSTASTSIAFPLQKRIAGDGPLATQLRAGFPNQVKVGSYCQWRELLSSSFSEDTFGIPRTGVYAEFSYGRTEASGTSYLTF
ncbi:hypothetical protein Baya_0056 [Bagarius yarrelli]|uniref:Uncharacterized protein n=1 Tax=Bagarius yarrelli TaxID=175774 RepID=A0A556TH60_BAGYA|nr:hypothetical protein Baya_0056 [Bagarius yarrelli]